MDDQAFHRLQNMGSTSVGTALSWHRNAANDVARRSIWFIQPDRKTADRAIDRGSITNRIHDNKKPGQAGFRFCTFNQRQ
jgi:hypothetical protein